MKATASIVEITRQIVGARFRWTHPVYLVHALTARCNARCGFCAWSPDFYDPRDQLGTTAIKRLYSDARRAGFIGLSMWGGEPLVHADFDEIASYAREIGLTTNMVTNGFLLQKKLNTVIENVDRVCISVDHPSELHDELRGVKGLFARIVDTTRELRRRAPTKRIIYICTLQKANIAPATIRALAELMAELGVVGVFNALREDAATDATDVELKSYLPSPLECNQAFETLRQLKREGYPILNSNTHLTMMAAGPPVYACHWPKFMLPVEANGDVVDCMHWGTRPIGNVKDSPFGALLKSPRLRALAGPAGESCHKCVSIHRIEISEVCAGNLEPLKSWGMLRQPRRGLRLISAMSAR